MVKANRKRNGNSIVSLNEMHRSNFGPVQPVPPQRPKNRGTKKKCDYCSRILPLDESFDKFITNDKIIQIAMTMYPGKLFGHIDCITEPIKTPKTMGWLWSVKETGGVKVSNQLSLNKKR